MKTLLFAAFIFCSTSIMANNYFGLMGGQTWFGSSEFDKYKVSAKGPSYGGFVGIGKDFVGLELFVQQLNAEGKIKHEGESGKINMNALGYGAALRFSFQLLFLRLGVGRYNLDQSIDLNTAANIPAAEEVYNVQSEGTTKNGILFGAGVHSKFKIGRVYLDYTRHQIADTGHYDSLSFGLSWAIPDRLFAVGKGD